MASVSGYGSTQQQSNTIQTMPAQSSWIAAFEYDATNLRLTTHLRDGSIHQHTFVMPLEWEALKTSQNHSKHWAQSIKGKKLSIRIKSAKAPKSELITKIRSKGRTP